MPNIEYYKDSAGEWRWRVTASNGEIIGASSEGYVRKIDAVKNVAALRGALQTLVSDLDDEG